MGRYDTIDVLKGIAVICMVIFHIFYFPNQYGFKEIRYDTTLLGIIAKIAQVIFITSVGVNLSLSKLSSTDKNESKKEFNTKSIMRILKIAGFAIFMSLFSWFLFGEKYIKFGILHFIAAISLLLFNYADDVKIIQTLFIISLIIYYLIKNAPDLFQTINDKLSFVLGFYNKKYRSIDHFSVFPWVSLVLIGMFIGNQIYGSKGKEYDNGILKGLKVIGKNSLEIYLVHWIILYIIYCHIYQKFCRVSL